MMGSHFSSVLLRKYHKSPYVVLVVTTRPIIALYLFVKHVLTRTQEVSFSFVGSAGSSETCGPLTWVDQQTGIPVTSTHVHRPVKLAHRLVLYLSIRALFVALHPMRRANSKIAQFGQASQLAVTDFSKERLFLGPVSHRYWDQQDFVRMADFWAVNRF